MSRSMWSLLPESVKNLPRSNQAELEQLLITGLVSDSRYVRKGDLFCALPGSTEDGRQFIAQALEAGAQLAIAQQADGESLGLDSRKQLFIVDNILDVIGVIASEFYDHPSRSLHLIGVTGTNGKTTTSYLIASFAQALGMRSGVMGTNGYGPIDDLRSQSLTTPGVIQVQAQLAEMRDLGIQLVAMEVSSHALAQNRVSGCVFKIAVLTNISRDHLDYHGDLKSYVAAKQLLFARPELEHVIANGDDAYAPAFLSLAQNSQHWVYSSSDTGLCFNSMVQYRAYISGLFEVNHGPKLTEMKMTIDEEVCFLFPALIGEFNFANLAAALLVMRALGRDLEDIAQVVPSLQVPEGRMQSVGSCAPQVIVDFAHTPDAIRVVLNALKPIAKARGGQLLVLFGCGGDRDRGKRPLMAAEVQHIADVAMVTADNARSESLEAIYLDIAKGFSEKSGCQIFRCDDRAEAIEKIIHSAADSDIVAILGKGHEKYQEIAGQRVPFDDVEEARIALGKRYRR